LAGFGERAGQGIEHALAGVAHLLTTIVRSPGAARVSWAQGRLADAQAQIAEAEVTRGHLTNDLMRIDIQKELQTTEMFDWAGKIMRGEEQATPEQIALAVGIMVQRNVIGPHVGRTIIRTLERDVIQLADLSTMGALKT
jgi:hypothetical protein